MGLRLISFVWVLLVVSWCSNVEAADCAPASSVFTIQSAQDVADIRSCATFQGNLVIAADGPEDVALDGIVSVSGNLDIENVSKLRSLSSTSLQSVQSFTLNSLPKLSDLSFPALSNFSSLKWYNLPALGKATVATGALGGEVQDITISNTALQSLDWIKWPVGSQLNLTNNDALETFAIPYSRINAGSAYTLNNNAKLSKVDLSSLTGIYGGLQISSNEKISSIDFDNLETIGGFVQLNGDLTNVSMPALNNINGALSIRSTTDISSLCDNLQRKKLQGHYDCTSNTNTISDNTPTQSTANPFGYTATVMATPIPSASSGSGSISFSKGAKIGVGIAVVVFVIILLVSAFFFIRYRIRSKVREIVQKPKDIESVSTEDKSANASSESFAKELETPIERVELSGTRERM